MYQLRFLSRSTKQRPFPAIALSIALSSSRVNWFANSRHEYELCRYVVLNPVRAKVVSHPRLWGWSSYRATVREMTASTWLTTDWILCQFGQQVRPARERYWTFVAEGHGGPRPWEQLTGQIYLGSEDIVTQYHPNRVIRDIPRRQAQRPSLRVLLQRKEKTVQLIYPAYRRYRYRLAEIAGHFGVHATRISCYLK